MTFSELDMVLANNERHTYKETIALEEISASQIHAMSHTQEKKEERNPQNNRTKQTQKTQITQSTKNEKA